MRNGPGVATMSSAWPVRMKKISPAVVPKYPASELASAVAYELTSFSSPAVGGGYPLASARRLAAASKAVSASENAIGCRTSAAGRIATGVWPGSELGRVPAR